MDRLIFLDIDGVLNNRIHALKRKSALRRLDIAIEKLDPACVMRLDEIARRGQATVVVHSTWRWEYEPRELEHILRQRGYMGAFRGAIPLPMLADCTPDDDDMGEQIRAWLQRNQWVRGYVILDDNSVSPLEAFHVRTSFEGGGLLQEHVEHALPILQREAMW